MYEQNNQVIITLIVLKTFVSLKLILDCNKIHTILKLIWLALNWFIDKKHIWLK